MRVLSAFRTDEAGATAIEYGLIAALICTAILGALTATGLSVGDQWNAWSALVVKALGG